MVQTPDPGSERVLSFSARTKLDMIRRILSFLHWHIMKEKKRQEKQKPKQSYYTNVRGFGFRIREFLTPLRKINLK
jgi:hypothetical protein